MITDLAADSVLRIARGIMSREREAIQAQEQRLGQAFVRAVEILYSATGRIVFAGSGKSGLLARRAAGTFSSLGTPAISIHAGDALHGDLGAVVEKDVLFAISVSGETAETCRMARALRSMHGRFFQIAAITRRADSTLGRCSNVVLPLYSMGEACPLGLAPTSSLAESAAILDSLAAGLAHLRGFGRADFAARHPGGTLGRAHLTVGELMRRGKNCPQVPPHASIIEAIVEMTRTRLGAVAIVTADGQVRGVLTDGDLRRNIKEMKDLGAQVFSLMTTQPQTITPDRSAQEALQAMASYQCDNLIVVDGDGLLQGILDERDIVMDAGRA